MRMDLTYLGKKIQYANAKCLPSGERIAETMILHEKFECWEERAVEVVQSDVSNDALPPSEDEYSFGGV